MALATLGTGPHSDIQRQFFNNMSTDRASFARGEEPIAVQDLFVVPSALVLQHSSEGSEARIADMLGQFVIGQHTTDVQILDCDPVEPLDQVGRNFVQVVSTTVCDLGLNACDLETLTLPSPASLLPPTQFPLGTSELFLESSDVPWVRDSLTVRESGQPFDPEIHADTFSGLRHGLNRFVQNQRHEEPTGGVLGYRYRCRIARELSGPNDLKSSKPGDSEVSVVGVPFEGTSSVLSRLFCSLLLEGGVICPLLEEISECCLKMSECLLLRNTRDLVHPFIAFSLLQFCEHRGGCIVVDRVTVNVGVSTSTQHPVVDESTGTEYPGKSSSLVIGWVASESVPELHKVMVRLVKYFVKPLGAGIPPAAKAAGLLPETHDETINRNRMYDLLLYRTRSIRVFLSESLERSSIRRRWDAQLENQTLKYISDHSNKYHPPLFAVAITIMVTLIFIVLYNH